MPCRLSLDLHQRTKSEQKKLRAFAWDISQPDGDPVEIHSENGYITAKEIDNKTIAGFTTAMSNGEFFI